MNDYEVTFANGEVAVITAWTPEAALAIAEEDGDLYGYAGISAVTVNLMARTPRKREAAALRGLAVPSLRSLRKAS